MIYWAPLLHFYQPPTQVHWVLEKVCRESYRPLVQLFKELPHAALTVNINAVLTQMLHEHGMSDVITGLRQIAEEGRLEFVGSAKYHPILPLIPEDAVHKQIMHNYQTNRKYFGDSYAPAGFFPPEMCYSRSIISPLITTGHRWVILSGVACPVPWPSDVVHRVGTHSENLAVLFRDDILSNRISFKNIDARSFIENLKRLSDGGKNIYVITAMDAETFGHHIRNWEKIFLAEVYETLNTSFNGQNSKSTASSFSQSADLAIEHSQLLRASEEVGTDEIQVVTMSKLLEIFPRGDTIDPHASSWSTTLDDIKAGNPYPLWKSPDNVLHRLQWQHLKIAIDLTKKAREIAVSDAMNNYATIADSLLDRAYHSDQFWWASRRPMWDINLVNRGLNQQREVILNAYKVIVMSNLNDDEKQEYYYRVVAARDLRSKITEQLLMY